MKKGEALNDRQPVKPSQPKCWECPYEKRVLRPSRPRLVNVKADPYDIDASTDL